MSELKPCPFCGCRAFLNDDPTGNGGRPITKGSIGFGRFWSVECEGCGADAGFWQEPEIAIDAWNLRIESVDGLRELIADMHALLQRCCDETDTGECFGQPSKCVMWTDHSGDCDLRKIEDRMRELGIEVRE